MNNSSAPLLKYNLNNKESKLLKHLFYYVHKSYDYAKSSDSTYNTTNAWGDNHFEV